ncbi:hypothetical protein VFPFJ_07427 [Purpureocillium lilacinum]|uniref:Uncharacterized protein n=1 Tax=Purpureocillium lilacinum TaxID=33203 RepID=A0A179GQ66_PURLI|nr:hypothetical protein VFPFJ_07427 [Purpureocillium lilacinum]OAQ79638.1 hypothetical protein VFPBJ_05223 [Purpureocillium lilacinum]OAQ88962.1 hypothetical protein VFPFJ_07427 [Purpureocillium lilacinum]
MPPDAPCTIRYDRRSALCRAQLHNLVSPKHEEHEKGGHQTIPLTTTRPLITRPSRSPPPRRLSPDTSIRRVSSHLGEACPGRVFLQPLVCRARP